MECCSTGDVIVSADLDEEFDDLCASSLRSNVKWSKFVSESAFNIGTILDEKLANIEVSFLRGLLLRLAHDLTSG